MKVVVYAQPRSGSTVFAKTLALLSSLKYKHEPFSFFKTLNTQKSNLSYILKEDNYLVKNTFGQEPLREFGKTESVFQNLEEFLSYFDKTILLLRRDLKLHTESMLNLKWLEENKGNDKLYHSKYLYENIPKSFVEKYYSKIEDYLTRGDKVIKYFNYPTFYYEDIFLDNDKTELKRLGSILNIDYKKFEPFFDKKNKYRQSEIHKRTV